MKKSIYIFAFFIIQFSCTNRQEDKLIMLAGKDYKYWLVEDSHPYIKTIYYFNRNSKWLIYEKYKEGVFKKYDGGDVFFIEKWHLSEKGVNIGGKDYRILNLTKFNFCIQHEKEVINMVPASENLLVSEHKAPANQVKVRVERTKSN